jgi:disulfide bond formation protein DsbB
MNWKKFLKPNKRKIVVTISLVLIGFLEILQNWPIEPPIWWNYWINFFILIPVLPIIFTAPFSVLYNPNAPAMLGFSLIGWIIIVFWSYFLSCLIFWIYDKFRKSKK